MFRPGDRVRVCSQSPSFAGQVGTVVATHRAIEVELPGHQVPIPFSPHELERLPPEPPTLEAA